MKYTIGEVGFATTQPAECDIKACVQRGRPHLHRLGVMGNERKALLQRALDQEPLPDGVVLVAGYWPVRITWFHVRWDTSGLVPKHG